MARTKMTRHQLKEQDEITTSLHRFTEIVAERQRQIIIVVAIVAVLIIGFVGWRVYAANQTANAQGQLALAISAFNDTVNLTSDQERFQKTLAEAQTTVDAYGSTKPGLIARYYMGLSYDGLGDKAKAIENLRTVAQEGDASIAGIARFALAGVHKKHGETPQAIDTLKQLYDSGGYSRSAVVAELAKLHETNNQLDQAKTYYQQIVTEFPDSPFRTEADQALKRLGVTTPAAAQDPS